MNDDEKQIEELAAKMRRIAGTSDFQWKDVAAIARDHFTKAVPAVPVMEEDREEAICNCAGWAQVSKASAEAFLLKAKLIPPRPVPTPGERFAASCSGFEATAKRFDDAVGPLIDLAKHAMAMEIDRGPDRPMIRGMAEDALAILHAKIGGVK